MVGVRGGVVGVKGWGGRFKGWCRSRGWGEGRWWGQGGMVVESRGGRGLVWGW